MLSFSVSELKSRIKENYVILDVRDPLDFIQKYIPGSVFIDPDDNLNEPGKLIDSSKQRICLVTPPGAEDIAVIKLEKLGIISIKGYLKGGFDEWEKAGEPVDMIIQVEADELALDIPHDNKLLVLDVRRENEFAEGHVKDAFNLPLAQMSDMAQIAVLEDTQNIYIHSGNDNLSLVAASFLKKQGYNNLRIVLGGWDAIKEQEGIPIEKMPKYCN
jgi:hydroxyacylglutathione hydrolase